jgi:hypothetical protein
MKGSSEEGKYKIPLAEKWTLEDWYVFPHIYEQVYFFMYSFLPNQDDSAVERIQRAYSTFPWYGGYSAVNFYDQLKYILPKNRRPYIVSIRYGSDGWIELALLVSIAMSIERIVKAIADTLDHCNNVYHNIYIGLQRRKLLRIKTKRKELQLKKKELEYIEESLQLMARLLGFQNLAEVNERTGSSYITLKILLSLYRRLRILAEYQKRGKTRL